MARTVYYTATSLDGAIADVNHSLAWLLDQQHDPAGPLNLDDLLAGAGAIVMGATTYRWLLEHGDGPWPYSLPTWVLTNHELPRADGDIRFARGDVRAIHEQMTATAGDRDLWIVGGGEVAGQFADAGLLDEIIVYLAPVTLGAGSPLLPRALDLQLLETAQNGAFVCARYTVVGPRGDAPVPA